MSAQSMYKFDEHGTDKQLPVRREFVNKRRTRLVSRLA
jgi:hypothetical protein